MTDTLEAPAALDMDAAFDKAISQQPTYDNAKLLGQDPNAAVKAREESSKPKEIVKEQPDKPENPEQKLADEVLKKTEEKPEKKDALSRVEGVPSTPEDKNEKAQSRWMELKGIEKEWKEDKPKLQSEISGLQTQLKELQGKIWKDDERKEFDELRTKNKAWEVESTPEWRQHIEVPFQQRENYIERAAKYCGIDAYAMWSALDEPDSFARSAKIDQLLSKSAQARAEENESREAKGEPALPSIPSNLSGKVAQVGDELQVIYHAMAKKRAEAVELGGSLEAQKTQATEKQQAEQQEQYQQQHGEVFDILSKKFPVLFADKEIEQAVRDAVPAEDARGKAYQAQAGEVVPFLTKENVALRAENIQLKKEAAERAAANPNMQQTTVKIPEKDRPEYASLDDAINAQRQKAPQTMGI